MSDKENAEKELQDIWEQFREEAINEVDPSEKSINEFMKEIGLTRYQTRYFLERKVQKGEMTKRLIRHENYYRPVL